MAAFCPQCGHATVKRVVEGRELDVCPDCGHIQWRNPVVATMVIVETPGGIILGRRAIDPGRGLWCLPGGFVNDDEHPERAAERECEEEIATGVDLIGLMGIYHVTRGDGTGMIALAYRAVLSGDGAPQAGHEMLEVGVFAPDNLPEVAFESHRKAIGDYMQSVGGRRR